MKFVALIDISKISPEERVITFVTNDPGPLPPIVSPERPDEAKDGGVGERDEEHRRGKEPPKKPS